MPANRLIHEKSPYLLQHAHNPVDWRPWGEEAFAAAREENKPVFLSVGYSTCHWCHVMEHESFENEGIAAVLNRDFVCVKVDREERPDIDHMYMAYVQAATGSGGWPMSVWLTPDAKPFVGGTYFPPDSRYGRPGFRAVLERIAEAWRTDRERVVGESERILGELRKQAAMGEGVGDAADAGALEAGFEVWRRSHDKRLGGFGHAPKFPRPVVLNFLLRYWSRTKNEDALEMVVATLKAMSRGGMNDQLGGGFHRYSVDEYWFVPHFEKMLYDQAQLAISYLEAFQITGDAAHALEVRRILDYVLRDMTSPDGAFYSAEDADSAPDAAHPTKKSEGAFYIWSASEIVALVGEDTARVFGFRYGTLAEGNVDSDPHGEFTGRNILFAAHSVEETAHHFDRDAEGVRRAISEAEAILLAHRAMRPRPHLDDKVLTAWNGLMISAFARAGAALREPRYAAAARRAAWFVRSKMWNGTTLLRRHRDGDAAIDGFLDDYAFFSQGLIDLYEAELDSEDLALAVALTARQRELFEDTENGGFFSTALGADPSLLLRLKEDYDGAEPGGNSIAVLNLLRLARMTGSEDLPASAERSLRAFATRLKTQPFAVPQMMVALDFALSDPAQIVLAGDDLGELLGEVHGRFLPRTVIRRGGAGPASAMTAERGQPTAYVCRNFVCELPVTTVAALGELLQ